MLWREYLSLAPLVLFLYCYILGLRQQSLASSKWTLRSALLFYLANLKLNEFVTGAVIHHRVIDDTVTF